MTKMEFYSASDESNTGYKETWYQTKGVTAYDKECCSNERGIPFRIDLSL